jgi:hypothetical protein
MQCIGTLGGFPSGHLHCHCCCWPLRRPSSSEAGWNCLGEVIVGIDSYIDVSCFFGDFVVCGVKIGG